MGFDSSIAGADAVVGGQSSADDCVEAEEVGLDIAADVGVELGVDAEIFVSSPPEQDTRTLISNSAASNRLIIIQIFT
jgi:hypothetical protein